MRDQLLICLMFLFGIAFGFVLARPSAVHAEIKLVRVTKLHLAQDTGAVPITGPVVGFSCSPNDDATADCYIASQP
jgi:hypothetical protein